MRTKPGWLIPMILFAAGSEGDLDGGGETAFVSNQRIVHADGLHNENTEMIRLDDRILLIFRGGETGQTGSSKARIKVFASMDEGQTFSLLSDVDANNLRGERDIRSMGANRRASPRCYYSSSPRRRGPSQFPDKQSVA